MTLTECEGAPTRKGGYVIFYASRDENQTMWCPVSILLQLVRQARRGGHVVYRESHSAEFFVIQDCRVIEADVAAAFEKVDGRIVYVGNRSE